MQSNLTTGSEALDRILGDGIPPGALAVVAGMPGSGKTVLAQQVTFANATPEHPALYLTTFSEPLPKLVHYLERFSFYDPERMHTAVVYRDLAQRIEEHGIEALPDLIVEMLQDVHAELIVVDSFMALHQLVVETDAFRVAVFRLARQIAALGVTALWLGEYGTIDPERYPELAVADLVIEMRNEVHGVRDERTLRVAKARGAMPLPGAHTFNIRSNGLNVFPRLVGADVVAAIGRDPERVPTHVDGLDALVGGGLWCGTSTFVVGPSGAGKTTLALSFLANGALAGHNGLLVTLHETPEQVRQIVSGFAGGVEALLGDRLAVQHYPAIEVDLVELLAAIKTRIASGCVQRIVIDSVRDLRDAALHPSRLRATLYNLIQFCASHRITVLINGETPVLLDDGYPDPEGLGSMVDNVLALYRGRGAERGHVLAVLKTRRSAHDARPHAVRIDGAGYHVTAPLAS